MKKLIALNPEEKNLVERGKLKKEETEGSIHCGASLEMLTGMGSSLRTEEGC